MATWPGDPECSVSQVHSMDKGAVCNLTQVSMCAHTGTHMDAPRHFVQDGKTIDELPFDAVIGRCRVIQVDCDDQITANDLHGKKLLPGERVLFKTRNSRQHWECEPFDKQFVSIRQDAAEYLKDSRVRTVGVDYLSIGGWEKDGVATHQIMLGAGIWVIEGLNLKSVKPGFYDMVCLPLKLVGADGAPCRVVLR